jgi:1,5-anhydro-D-fructose reductase (1,5-anhydro-D-mannitol-forming)
MNTMKTIRWGMIGCGAVAEKKSGPGFYKAKHSKLIGVFARNIHHAEDYAKRHGISKVYPTAEEMVTDPEIDAIYIATPPAFHKEYALWCARYGKAVYLEKPMAMNYQECLEIIKVFKDSGIPLFVAFYRRAMEKFLKIRELVGNKAIGDIRCVNVVLHQPPEKTDFNRDHLPWRVLPQVAGGGKCLDMGIHTIDFLDYVFGPIEEVHGIAENQAGLYDVEDIVTATWRFASGVQATGNWCYTCFENRDEVEMIGSEGRIWFEFFSGKPVFIKTKQGVQEFNYPDPEHVQQPFIQTVVNELLGIGKCPGDAQSAARASLVMDQLLRRPRKGVPLRSCSDPGSPVSPRPI